MYQQPNPKLLLLFFLCLYSSVNVSFAEEGKSRTPSSIGKTSFMVRDSLNRYWNDQISNNLPKPSFLVSKASPLTAVDAAFFAKLANQNALSTQLPSFCSSANLFCFTDLTPSSEKHIGDANLLADDGQIHYHGQRHYGQRHYDLANFGADGQQQYSGQGLYGQKHYKPKSQRQYKGPQKYYKGRGQRHYGVADGKPVSTWVEPGIFFRESNLKQGTLMPMPDIRDKMPKRSFLPRTISSKLPFPSSKLSQLNQIFHASENSGMEDMLKNTIEDCEMAPNQGETRRCVGSIEDMIDFATSLLGHNVVVRSMEGVEGSGKEVMVGVVKGINGGKITKSVSCHQSMYPYMVYYCHSVPKVRVYEVEVLDAKTKQKINKGVVVCHVDTSTWSPEHIAFAAVGSSPGKTEVCHWIYEGAMNWAMAD